MQAELNRWGGSLALRIPKALAGRFGLFEGMRVSLEAEGERIVISIPPRHTLNSLLAGMTPENMHEAFNWGDDRGREIVD